MTGRAGARPTQPAKKAAPVKKVAPKPSEAPPDVKQGEPQGNPAVHRAGGWIDRGDGRGWELEES